MSDGARITFVQLLERGQPIEIPIIQRDYAQGRIAVKEVREPFLAMLHAKLATPEEKLVEPLDLDFVYGSLEGQGLLRFSPLDGQQRLTTLFLLHWYLACLDRRYSEFHALAFAGDMMQFTYQTRSSSNEFFQALASADIDVSLIRLAREGDGVARFLMDRPWFFLSWQQDPTIQSALIMLDAIHDYFHASSGFYGRLLQAENPYITFQFLNLRDFGLTDELYIKMNARGKPLTQFESFKARLEQHIDVRLRGETLTLQKRQLTVKEYFSHQIDTKWADLFWCFRDTQSNAFDEQLMNFIRTVVSVYFPHEREDWEAGLDALRDGESPFSFYRYDDLGCFTDGLIRSLICLLDTFSDSAKGLRTFLEDSSYYDEATLFKKALVRMNRKSRTGQDYEDSVRFYAYCKFIENSRGQVNPQQLADWMRVISNLAVNTIFNNLEDFQRALLSVNALVGHCNNILFFIADRANSARIEGFLSVQIHEEQVKASLLCKGPAWQELIMGAERHGYFKGQIGFLLSFSGINAYVESHGSVDWSEADDTFFLEGFRGYLEKATAIFGAHGLNKFTDFLWERALLAHGDYLLAVSRNHSFLIDNDRDVSWKRLLRGDGSNNRRDLVKQVFDKIDLSRIEISLKEIITSTPIDDEWRRMIVAHPEAIDYCQKRFIRKTTDRGVILLTKIKTSGQHCELYLFDLMLNLYPSGVMQKSMHPFTHCRLQSVATEEESSGLLLQAEEAGLPRLQIFYTAEGFTIRVSGFETGHLCEDVRTQLMADYDFSDSGLELELSQISPSTIMETLENLENLAAVLRNHLGLTSER